MVSDLIWAPDFFGPWEIWSLRNLGPKKFFPQEIWALRSLGAARKSHVMIFMRGPNFLGPIFLGDQTSCGPNFFGTKKVTGPNDLPIYILHDLLLSHARSVSPPEFKTKGPMHNHDIAKFRQISVATDPNSHHCIADKNRTYFWSYS